MGFQRWMTAAHRAAAVLDPEPARQLAYYRPWHQIGGVVVLLKDFQIFFLNAHIGWWC